VVSPEKGGLQHTALLYRSQDDYRAGVAGFIRAALARREVALAAVPGPAIGLLREALGGAAGAVAFADMTALGRNPARIIPFVSDFAASHPGRRIAYVGEPAWPGRSAAELIEAAKHEALINLAFTGLPLSILCPYHTPALPAAALATARQTHPHLTDGARPSPSPAYLGPGGMPAPCLEPLPAPPPGAATVRYQAGLQPVRELTRRRAARAWLSADRAADLVIAVSEVAANTLAHTRSGGTLHIWQTPAELVCQLHDQGWITDPLAGRRNNPFDHPGGHGLWVVNQLCDLVQTRTSPSSGTTTRLSMALPG
jgi:anti-sigma regulatory factor (Ser/Thr protein kinase)